MAWGDEGDAKTETVRLLLWLLSWVLSVIGYGLLLFWATYPVAVVAWITFLVVEFADFYLRRYPRRAKRREAH